MKKRNRLLTLILTMVLLACMLPLKVSANSPEPTPYYTFYLANLPEGAEYVDLLIHLRETDEMYTDLITENIPDSFSQDAQILSYCENDYRSYTFHYRDALSMIKIGRDGDVRYFTGDEAKWDEAHIRFDHAADIDARGQVMLAMLNAQGDILQISQPLDLTNVSKFSYRLGDFYYDCATGELIIEHIENNRLDPPGQYIASSVFGILITCLLEWLTSLLFPLKGYRGLIVGTNVFSDPDAHGLRPAVSVQPLWLRHDHPGAGVPGVPGRIPVVSLANEGSNLANCAGLYHHCQYPVVAAGPFYQPDCILRLPNHDIEEISQCRLLLSASCAMCPSTPNPIPIPRPAPPLPSRSFLAPPWWRR